MLLTTTKVAGNAVKERICGLDYAWVRDRCSEVNFADGVRLGAADVFLCQSSGLQGVSRSPRHIRADGVDDFLLLAPLVAPLEARQAGEGGRVAPGGFILLGTAKPFEAVCHEHANGIYSELAVRVSGPLLRQHVSWIDACRGQTVQFRPGVSRMLRAMLKQILEDSARIDERDAAPISDLLIKTIAATVLQSPDLHAVREQIGMHPHHRIQLAAIAYIREHLADPALCIEQVAAHCRVSIRHIHACFSHNGATLGAYIRTLRLEQCRDELVSATKSRTIGQLAMKWGFSNASSFSRAYQAHFGISPRADSAQLSKPFKLN